VALARATSHALYTGQPEGKLVPLFRDLPTGVGHVPSSGVRRPLRWRGLENPNREKPQRDNDRDSRHGKEGSERACPGL